MSIFRNAIDAIQVGVEDYAEGSDPRLKSAVRNVHAGVLLLFKSKLQSLSPHGCSDVLLMQRIKPTLNNGKVTFVGTGRRTVDVQAIKERFKELQIDVDWKDLDSATNIRNDIEHHYSSAPVKTFQEALAKMFLAAVRFTKKHLQRDLQQELSADSWAELVKLGDVYKHEMDVCRQSRTNFQSGYEFARANISTFFCSECHSDLIEFENTGGSKCRACGHHWPDAETAVVKQAGSRDAYLAAKDGDEETVIDCPGCFEFTYIVADASCVSCDASFASECGLCGMQIPACEINGEGYCSWCNHMMSKDD